MKIKTFLITIILFNYSFCIGNQIFDKANEAYNKQLFQNALNLYESIHEKTSSCWFNMGNCYYKLNKYNLAIAHWIKALKNSKNQEDINDIKFNLAKVENILALDNKFGEKDNFIVKFFSISYFYFQIIFLIFWYLTFLFIVIKKRFYKKMAILVLCNIIVFGCLGIKYNNQTIEVGITTKKDTPVYAGPDTNYHILGTLDIAKELKINHKDKKWIKISSKDLSGWILSDSIFIL